MIDAATRSDLPQVHALLQRVHLPLDGVDDHVETMLVARQDGHVVGTAALEIYEDGALLRSVAVDPQHQGTRVGHELTHAALQLAASRGIQSVFLLTTTAEGFFPRFGFEHVGREIVPPSIMQSVEFQSACPQSAIVMRKSLHA